MERSPPPARGASSAIEPKRARKRSRYLSPPYADTDGSAVQEEPPPDVCVADVLSALRAAALLSLDPNAAQAFRFLALYRRRLLHSPGDAPAPAAGVGHKPPLNPSAGAMPTPAVPAPGSKKKKTASQSDVGANFASKKRRRKPYKKMMKSTGQEHFRNPVALVLDLAQGTPLPSRDDLLSTFCRFGSVIHSETAQLEDHRSARVVFATRAEAEAAYSCVETLGAFGPPFATPRLQDVPPVTLNASLPVPKLPLKDVRKNLERMILSLTSRSSSFTAAPAGSPEEAKLAMGNLVGEMQGLLAKVDKMLHDDASTVHHH